MVHFKFQVFRYNASDDRLELCLEPHGHFPVEPGIEERVLNSSLLNSDSLKELGKLQKEVEEALASGSTGIAVNTPMNMSAFMSSIKHPKAFSGQGHSLISGSENARMPTDLEPTVHGHARQHRAMKFNELTHDSHPDCIEEETEEPGAVAMDTDSKRERGATEVTCDSSAPCGQTAEPVLKRVGPGYSVLDPGAVNDINTQSDMFKTLASQLETITRKAAEDPDPVVVCNSTMQYCGYRFEICKFSEINVCHYPKLLYTGIFGLGVIIFRSHL